MKVANSIGKPKHWDSIGVANFFYWIFSYLSFLLLALTPCQGKLPFKKYIRMYPIDSKSSLLLLSNPKWVFIDEYLHSKSITWLFHSTFCSLYKEYADEILGLCISCSVRSRLDEPQMNGFQDPWGSCQALCLYGHDFEDGTARFCITL